MLKANDWKLLIKVAIFVIIFLTFSLSASKYISVFTVSVVKNAEIAIKNAILPLHPIRENYGFATEINFRSEYVFATLELTTLSLITGMEPALFIQLPIGIILVISLLALFNELRFTGIMSYILTYLSAVYMLALFYSNYSVFSISWFLLILSVTLFIRIVMKHLKRDIIALVLVFIAMINYHYTAPFMFLTLPLCYIMYVFITRSVLKSRVSTIDMRKCIIIELILVIMYFLKITEGTFLSYYNVQTLIANLGIGIFKIINSFLERDPALNPRITDPFIYYTDTLIFFIKITGIACFILLSRLFKTKHVEEPRSFLIPLLMIFIIFSSIMETLIYSSTRAGLVLSIPRAFQIFGHIPLIASLTLMNHLKSSFLRRWRLSTTKLLLLGMLLALIFLNSLGFLIRFTNKNIYFTTRDVLKDEDVAVVSFITRYFDYYIKSIEGSGDTIGYITLASNADLASRLYSSIPFVDGTLTYKSNILIVFPIKDYRWISYGVRQQIPVRDISTIISIILLIGCKIYDDGYNIVIRV